MISKFETIWIIKLENEIWDFFGFYNKFYTSKPM